MASSKKVAIIGAGLAGASVMRALVGSSESIHCEVFEKSRGWGGRMSTRRVESPDGTFYFDHGAQYFTVRDGRFGSVVDGLAKNGIVKPFEAQWAIPTESEQKNKSSFADTSRFWVQGGMNRLCKNIAEEIQTKIPDQVQVHFQKKIVSLRPASHSNQLELVYEEKPGSTSGVTQQTKQFDAVVSTMPLPQFLPVSKSIGSMDANLQSGSLFDDSGWVPCLALMLGLKSKPGYRSASDVADAGFIADGDGGEHWFCEQSERFYPAESELSSWVVHASSGFSKKYYQTNEKEVVDLLLQKLTTAGQPLHSFADSSLVVQKLHRWRFAKPVGKMTSDLQSLSGHGVFLAGDGLTGGRVEGAYLSGLDAAQKVLAFLQERTRR